MAWRRLKTVTVGSQILPASLPFERANSSGCTAADDVVALVRYAGNLPCSRYHDGHAGELVLSDKPWPDSPRGRAFGTAANLMQGQCPGRWSLMFDPGPLRLHMVARGEGDCQQCWLQLSAGSWGDHEHF